MEKQPNSPAPSRQSSWINLILPVAMIFGLVLLLSLNTGASTSPAAENPLETTLKTIAGFVAAGAEIAAGLVIAIGVLIGSVNYLWHFFRPVNNLVNATESIRLRLGRTLALGLEFTVASDILRTAVAPTRQDILNLGAIVLLRSLLNFFLEHEIQQAEIRNVERG